MKKLLITLMLATTVISSPAYAKRITAAQREIAVEQVRIAKLSAANAAASRLARIREDNTRRAAIVYGKPLAVVVPQLTPTQIAAEEVRVAKLAAATAAAAKLASIQAANAAQAALIYATTPVAEPVAVVAPVTNVPLTFTGLPILDAYNTPELTAHNIAPGKTNDNVLNVINAEYAWSRGYTGAGSTILIIDSGINTTHTEFAGSIAYTKDFINSKYGIVDVVGHGTAMAGIAAANYDGVGMAGVAPDAMLAIAKVTDNTSFNFSAARNALVWGNSIGAVVANISASSTYDSTYLKNMVKLSDGNYTNTDPRYVGNYFMNEDPNLWAKSLSTNMVIVNSAGNNGYAYANQPGTLATAVDATGKLILGGQLLIVGAWDTGTNTIASYSNKAGSICKIVVNGACGDTYKVSDFYIMAPGNMFAPGKTGTDTYVIGTGTSEATAVVSGAVAIIHQQWPQMTAANIVKLLLVTANKDLPGYNETVMGQGLLDLEKATRPIGPLGIPTIGRTTAVAPTGGFSTNTSGGLSSLNGLLNSVMALDSFGRDYYVDMSRASNNKTPRVAFNPIANASFYEDYNPYNKLTYFSNNGKVQSGAYDVKLSTHQFTSQAMVEVGKTTLIGTNTKMRVGFGALNERNAWIGNSISGAMGTVNSSYTSYTNLGGTHNLTKEVSICGTIWLGVTQANLQQSGLITSVGNAQSYSWNMVLDYTDSVHSVGTTVSQPMTVYKGTVNVAIPVGLLADGAIAYNRSTVSITPTVNEYDFGVYYKYKTSSLNLIAYGEHQLNYLNQRGVANNQVGLGIVKNF
jgi:subtilisin family serine protease